MKKHKATILIVDDEEQFAEILADRLEAQGFNVVIASNGREGLEQIHSQLPAIVLLDLQMPEMDGMQVLKKLKVEKIETTVIIMTAFGTIEKAVEAMKVGAFDFITKPLDTGHLNVVIDKALERERLKREREFLLDEIKSRYDPIIGQSPAMKKTIETAKKVAEAKSTVLLLGESGTGKEILARAIHRWSPRHKRSFVPVNCSAIPSELLESELFGHEKGAFTGAHETRRGKFELAHEGTVFLDEIGDLQLPLQSKLLRVLQEEEFTRVGGSKLIRVDVRVIAATNRDLKSAVENGRFREDLYYRLNVVSITLPPLRERKSEIPIFVEFFLKKYLAETKKPLRRLSPDAMSALLQYDWPGNIRELQNVIERVVVLSEADEIAVEDLPLDISNLISYKEGTLESTGAANFHQSAEQHKRNLIIEALKKTNGNQTKAAELLGLQRTYLVRLIKNLGIRQ